MNAYHSKILVFANAVSLAHPTRMWMIACELADLGYSVHFATSSEYFRFLLPSRQDITIHSISSVPLQTFNERLFNAEFIFTEEELERDTKEDTALIELVKPDIIFSDLRLTAFIPARIRKIPYFTCSQYHWSGHIDSSGVVPPVKPVITFGRKISERIEPFLCPIITRSMIKKANRFFCDHPLARDAHIPPFKSLPEFYLAGDHVLFADLPFLYEGRPLAPHEHFIGPIIWTNPQTPWPENWPRDFAGQKMAYVTMGSTGTFYAIPAILDGLRNAGYKILMSGFGQNCASIDLTDTWVAPFVPSDDVLKIVQLVVCNGGSGTTYHAVSRGVPVISVPQNMDQALHSRELVQHGLARSLYPDQITASRVVEAIREIENDTAMGKRMDSFRARIDGFKRKEELSRLLSSL